MSQEPSAPSSPKTTAPITASLALHCRGLTKHYPGVVAIKDFDFEAAPGHVHGIVGENGAGKSTFIKVLAGAVQPDAGEIEVFGEKVAGITPDDAGRLGIGVAYQDLSLLPDLTVAENVWLRQIEPGRLRTVSPTVLRARTMELYERLDAPWVNPDRKARTLSVAARHVTEIVAAVATRPSVLILDEATAALAIKEAEWALGLARQLAAEGTLVLFISHRLPEIRSVADRITVMRDGLRVLTDDMAALNDDEVVEAMLGRKPHRLFPPPVAPPKDSVALSVRDLTVGHRVQDVSFDLHEGEILGVGGLQGQGQTVLLGALFGLVRYSGEIAVRGKPMRVRSPRKALHAGIGIALVPEDRRTEGLHLPRPIRHNVSLPVLPRLTSARLIRRSKETAAVRRALDRLQVKAASIEQPVATLSGGNQQKIVIAKLLLVGCSILLFNDLTRGIDVGTKAEIFQLSRELAAEGHAILMYSSDNQELAHMCDRVLVLRAGQVGALLDGEGLTEERIMRAAIAVGGEGAPAPKGVGNGQG